MRRIAAVVAALCAIRGPCHAADSGPDPAAITVSHIQAGVLSAYAKRQALRIGYSSEGWWDEDWGDAPPPDDRDSPLQRRLRTTGHQLEWMALAPAGLRPSDAALSRAANYLAGQLAEMPLSHSQVFYPPLTHSVRSLLLLK